MKTIKASKSEAQKARTKINKSLKYAKLILARPNDPHLKKWEKFV